jgi:signal transduction histidine kinase
VAVTDEGVGMPAEALPRIFDKYVRIANPETATVRGLGLGLSLVRALVEAHGGRIEVASEPGKGSCFRLLLPP